MVKIKYYILIFILLSSLNLHSQTWTYYTNDWSYNTIGDGQSNPVMVDFYGNLWVANARGYPRELWKYDIVQDSWTNFVISSNDEVSSIFVESEKSFWLSTRGSGAYHFDGQNIIRQYTLGAPNWDGMPKIDLVDILVDGNGHVIATTDRDASWNGFLEYYPVSEAPFQNWNHYCMRCPSSERLSCGAIESNGQVLWFGDVEDGVYRVNITNYDNRTIRFGGAFAFYIAIGFNNTKYIAIMESAVFDNIGCIVLSNNYNFSYLSDADTFQGPCHVLIDNDNRKWFSAVNDGASVYDGTNWTYYTTNNGLAGQFVMAIAQTMDGDYWFFHLTNRISRLRLPGREGFQLVSFESNSGENDEKSRYLKITGTGFRQGAKVKLKRDGETDIWATDLQVVDAHTILCRFDLNSAALGNWHIVGYNRYRWPHFNYKLIKEDAYEVKAPTGETGDVKWNIKDSYIYPNVIKGERRISIKKMPEKVIINIYDRIGNKLKTAEVTEQNNEIDISDLQLSTGIYFIIAEDIDTGKKKVLKFMFVK